MTATPNSRRKGGRDYRAGARRQPTVEELRADFGMSRATAYRWRAAWTYMQDAILTPHTAQEA